MCGFVGIFGNYDLRRLKQITDSIYHRGPDDSGFYNDNKLFLGFRRLSIIDLSLNAHQPMSTKDGRFTIVFNGEIYNYKILKNELISKGHIFTSNSDTEVILLGYKEWGQSIINKLNGMFAFGIWDSRNKELFLARDRVGIKPLYYYHDPQIKQFIFSSEIRAFINSEIIPLNISIDALYSYLKFGSVRQPNNIIKNIFSLLPGQYLIFNNSGIRIKTYWQNGKGDLNKKENTKNCLPKLDKIFYHVIEDQIVSDVPYGLFLSGGVDSTLILTYMSEIIRNNVETFSIGFESGLSPFNEISYAHKTAEIYRSNHHELIIGIEQIKEELLTFINSLDQPSYDGLNSYFISKFAKKFVTVSLSGLGGDELFLGYNHQIRTLNYKKILKAVDPFKTIIKNSTKFFNNENKIFERNIINKIRNILETDNLFSGFYNKDFIIFNDFELKKIISKKSIIPKKKYDSDEDLMNIILYDDIKHYMRNTLLRDMDAVSMFNSLEVRVPYLDNRIIDFANSLPLQLKYNEYLGGKAILKNLLLKRNKSLSYVVNKKSGFVFPLEYWLRKYFKEEIYTHLVKEPPVLFQIFNTIYITKLVEDFFSGKNIYYMKIWSLFVLSLWLKINKFENVSLCN